VRSTRFDLAVFMRCIMMLSLHISDDLVSCDTHNDRVIVLLDVMVVNQQQTLSPLRLFLSLTLIQPSQENVILKGTLDHLEESLIFGSGGTLLLSSLKHWKKLQRLWKVLIPRKYPSLECKCLLFLS
jgi:hypothetical protein